MVTEDVITLSVPQVIDLALNSPEIGAVNFNLLQNVLHIIAKQMQIHETNVEFRGKDGEKIKMLVAAAAGKTSSSVLLTEYAITMDDHGNKKRTEMTDASKPLTSTESPMEVVVLVQPDTVQTPQMTICLSQQTIIDIQDDINELKQQVEQLMDLPKNSNLMEAIKSKDKPVVEMFQIMSLAKRVDASEAGLQKLGSLVEDLTNEIQYAQMQVMDAGSYHVEEGVDGDNEAAQTNAQGKPSPQKSVQQAVTANEKQAGTGSKGAEPPALPPEQQSSQPAIGTNGVKTPTKRPPPELFIRIGNCEKRLQAIEDSLKACAIPIPIVPGVKYPSRIDLPPIEPNKTLPVADPTPVQTNDPATPAQTGGGGKKEAAKKDEDMLRLPTNEAVLALQKDINKIKRELRKMKITGGGGKDTDDSGPIKIDRKRSKKPHVHNDSQLGELEAKVRDSNETLVSMDQNFNNQILQLQNSFSVLEMEVNSIMEKLAAALPGGDTGVESIGDLFKKMQGMQIDIENIAETTTRLIDDLAMKKTNFESLNETVELLKTIKADKEDLEDALADKADKCAINRKVSHDQFDTACDELSRGIEEALEKLTTQELLWQQALDEIQFEISNKLDKMELGPLRDFINNKLRMLQERMKSLTALKKEQEAAGTKSKFLRNVNCISCDKDVVMRKQMDASLMPQPRALPPSRSMAPYLAYELDALRKQQKTSANSRNLNHFESAMTGGKSPRMDDHVCNRYCGGSHTVTTPQQRVTRMGHFLAQWGPGAVPVTDAVPTKEEPKQEKKSSLVEQGDQKKLSQTDTKDDGIAPSASQQGERKSSKASIKSGSQTKVTREEPALNPSLASGPAADEKKSSGSQEKVRTSITSARSSQTQKSAKKRGSKGTITGSKVTVTASLKGSKQGISQEGLKEVVTGEITKDVPEEIPEETPSEVAAAESPAAEPPEMANSQNENMPESAEEAEKSPEVHEQAIPETDTETEPAKEE